MARSFLTFTRCAAVILAGAIVGQVCCVAYADAKARLAAVIVLRSTSTARDAAVKQSKAIADKISQEPGWDARTVDARGKSPADAAATVGAEVYIIGQYMDGSPAHVSGAVFKVATDERLGTFSYDVNSSRRIPDNVGFLKFLNGDVGVASAPLDATKPSTISIPSGNLISVEILSDIGSRISQEGDTFAVVTAEDYYYNGQLILPKNSPGYGIITHLKRAGGFHAGGELTFTVKRLVTPSRTDLLVETNGATADVDKTTEQNGNAFGQYLLWGIGMFAKRGNDILIKKGSTFHVSTLDNPSVPVSRIGSAPAVLDPTQATIEVQVPQSLSTSQAPEADSPPQQQAPVTDPTPTPMALVHADPASNAVVSPIAPPSSWVVVKQSGVSSGVTVLGSWAASATEAPSQTLTLVTQPLPAGMAPDTFARLVRLNIENSIGQQNLHTFQVQPICGGTQHGWYIETSTMAGSLPIESEQTIGVSSQASYIATYRRPRTAGESAAARQSLQSLCVPN